MANAAPRDFELAAIRPRRPRGGAALRRLHPRGGRAARHRSRHRGRRSRRGRRAELARPTGCCCSPASTASRPGSAASAHLDTEVAEVKSMYVAPAYRGHGPRPGDPRRARGGSPRSTAAARPARHLRLPDRRRRPLPRRRLPRGAGLQRQPEGRTSGSSGDALSCSGPSAAARGLGVDRDAVDVDLEVEVAADRDRVAGLADGADPLALPDPLAPVDQRPAAAGGRRSSCAARLRRGSAGSCRRGPGRSRLRSTRPLRDRDQRRPAGGDDVEALVGAAAAARRAELADRAARPVRALDREDVAVVGHAAVASWRCGPRPERRGREERDESEKGRALQWCSMTRSTMLYSSASSALMK